MAWVLERDDFYPPHLEVANLFCHHRKGKSEVGRVITCKVCDMTSNSRTRNGDAKFLRAHRRCWRSRFQ